METEPTSPIPAAPLINYHSHDPYRTWFATKAAMILWAWAATDLVLGVGPAVTLFSRDPLLGNATPVISVLTLPILLMGFYCISLGVRMRRQSRSAFASAVRDCKRVELLCWLGWFAVMPIGFIAADDWSVRLIMLLPTLFPITISMTRATLQDLAWRNVGPLRPAGIADVSQAWVNSS